MQPYYEARGLGRQELAGRSVPPLVTQIADGENGGVMMNEFPSKYFEVVRESSGSATPMLNGTEYLERLFAAGVSEDDLPVIQPLFQNRIWDRMSPGDGPERLAGVIEELRREDGRFHMEGGSWTNDISWVRGYDSLLIPMERASAAFEERVLARNIPTTRFRLPQRSVSPAHSGDELLPLLGRRERGPTTARRSRGARARSSPTTSKRKGMRDELDRLRACAEPAPARRKP